MASEKRDLIDRKELIKAVERKQFAIADNTHPYEAIRIQGRYFREVVDDAPSVDAVPVVRCKDCTQWGGVAFGNVCRRWSTPLAGMKNCTGPNDFCSYGERRNNETD